MGRIERGTEYRFSKQNVGWMDGWIDNIREVQSNMKENLKKRVGVYYSVSNGGVRPH